MLLSKPFSFIAVYFHFLVKARLSSLLAEVETVFMPWLMDETEKALDKKILARTLLDCEKLNT